MLSPLIKDHYFRLEVDWIKLQAIIDNVQLVIPGNLFYSQLIKINVITIECSVQKINDNTVEIQYKK